MTTIEALQNVLNALKSEIGDEKVAKILLVARDLFFKAKGKNAFYDETVYPAIFDDYSEVIASTPAGGGSSTVHSVSVLPTIFLPSFLGRDNVDSARCRRLTGGPRGPSLATHATLGQHRPVGRPAPHVAATAEMAEMGYFLLMAGWQLLNRSAQRLHALGTPRA